MEKGWSAGRVLLETRRCIRLGWFVQERQSRIRLAVFNPSMDGGRSESEALVVLVSRGMVDINDRLLASVIYVFAIKMTIA